MITIRLVGGPADGQTLAIPDQAPPPLYLVPLSPLGDLFTSSLEPSPIQTAEYEPLRGDGDLPRIADDGVYLYEHRAAPLTAEGRKALTRKRAEGREADERRTAELDEAWQEIRRGRPHYPESWRDL